MMLEFIPFLIACTILLGAISLKSPVLLFCLLAGSLISVVIHQIGRQVNLPRRQVIFLQVVAVGVILACFWLDYFADPAQAQFFKRAEDFFRNNLTQGTSNTTNAAGTQAAISLIFNVLRALYLLYIAVALIGVINAVRRDDDWQNIARTPLLVVIAVTIADVLTGFVIGN
ncbi:hypothetical protein DSM106972_041890 [Dulcicalothrix desertica PCC 7102]|uniref:Uncharacterized protein n=2 Tax=Dulcicalothrix desertica TaxID=32056 RepID=A0A3S1IYR2_9CYAN|nr:hypothetical protein DSM106972_041890 [Dulcicalothrix desertica PCC 7102]TWH42626.1 hypothetical protein CAL7102_06300 [Dulcicalothrix desertica PCC 7102]